MKDKKEKESKTQKTKNENTNKKLKHFAIKQGVSNTMKEGIIKL